VVVVVLGLLGVYLLTMAGHTTSVDGESYMMGTRALLHHTTVLAPTPDIDDIIIPVVHKNGGLTTLAPIGSLLLFSPGAVAGTIVSRMFPAASREEVFRLIYLSANSVLTALTAGVLLLLCRALGARLRTASLLALVYGLGTWAWAHAQSDFTEPGTALMLTAAMLGSLAWWRVPTARRAATVGLLAGCVVLTRASALLFVPVLMVVGVTVPGLTRRARLQHVAAFVAGGIAPMIAFSVNSWLRFGELFDNGYSNLPYSTPVYEGVFGLLFSTGKGIVFYAPVCIVVVFGARLSYLANRRYAITVGLLLVAHLSVYSRFKVWSGENSYGPRYMFPLLPVVIALLAPIIDSGRQWVRGVKAAGFIGFAVPGLLGTLMYFNGVSWAQRDHVLHDYAITELSIDQTYDAWHFVPRESPLMQAIRSVPDLVRNTVDRIEGEPGGIGPIPAEYEQRIGWYGATIQLDTWWAWWSARGGPAAGYLFLLVPLGCLTVAARLGAQMLPRWRRRIEARQSRSIVTA